MSSLTLRPREQCLFDVVALGEVMLRLDPGEDRIRTTRAFRVWDGGGEYNVARGLSRCFGLRTSVVTALADNEIGRLLEDLIQQGGVDTSLVRWIPYDGVGRIVRNGLNFTERGFGVRGALGVSDRGNTAASQLAPGQIDWDHLFGELGVRWLHTGGIFAGLSTSTAEVADEALTAAARHGTVVSYDLNYRPSLWESVGGGARAREVNRRLVDRVDVIIGHVGHYAACLGLDFDSASDINAPDIDASRAMLSRAAEAFPNLAVVAATQRVVRTATVNDWSAIAWGRGTGVVEAASWSGLEILDRVGGGDGFAAGLIYGLLETGGLQKAVEYGTAHGALVMTTPGDVSAASLAEVQALMLGPQGRARR